MEACLKQRVLQIKDQFTSLGEITTRSQFGGYSVSADRVMFGLIHEHEFYLRATRRSEDEYRLRGMSKLIYTKRGVPVSLNYYQVNAALWSQSDLLLSMGRQALDEAKRQQQDRAQRRRLKDLPNIGQGIERLLWKAGIQNVDTLRNYGAKGSYLLLRHIKRNLSIKVLFALEGAICGRHAEAIPRCQRNELQEWFNRQGRS